ncbi:MAG: cupin [Patescibacteria group bacterium]
MNQDKSLFKITPFSQRIEKPWGYEIIFTPEISPIAGKLLHINAQARFSLQYHDEKQETLFLASGRANIIIENEKGKLETIEMEPQKGYYIAPFQKHRCQAITDCDILEASTKEKGTTVRIEDDYKRTDETEEDRKSLRNKLPNEKEY